MNESPKKILSALQKDSYLTQEELSKIVGINLVNIKKNMKKLQDLSLLKRNGTDKSGEWIIIHK